MHIYYFLIYKKILSNSSLQVCNINLYWSCPCYWFCAFWDNSINLHVCYIDWLIDWIEFYAGSAIFQPCNIGMLYWIQMLYWIPEVFYPRCLLHSYDCNLTRQTFPCINNCLALILIRVTLSYNSKYVMSKDKK